MLYDSIKFIDDIPKAISNLVIEYGTTLPATGSEGELFFLTQDSGSNLKGLYVYNSVGWIATTPVTEQKVTDGLGYTPVNRAGDYAENTEMRQMYVRQAADQSGTSFTINFNNGDYFKLTATGNSTITFSNFTVGKVAAVIVECTNFGGKTISWPLGTKWAGGASPTFTSTGIDVISIIKDKNEVYRAFVLGKDVK